MPGLGEVSQDLAEFKRRVMAMHSPEERLEGLSPEEIARVLPPEDLARALRTLLPEDFARVLRTMPQAELDHLFQLLKTTQS